MQKKKSKSTSKGASKYARKIRGDYPVNSPYRTRWSKFRPDGGRVSRRVNAVLRIS